MAVLKVFARKEDRPAILEKTKPIEDYEAFVVVEAPPGLQLPAMPEVHWRPDLRT